VPSIRRAAPSGPAASDRQREPNFGALARKAVSLSRSCSVQRADSMIRHPSAANALAVANPTPRLDR